MREERHRQRDVLYNERSTARQKRDGDNERKKRERREKERGVEDSHEKVKN